MDNQDKEPTVIEESGLKFSFSDETIAIKFDDRGFYRNFFLTNFLVVRALILLLIPLTISSSLKLKIVLAMNEKTYGERV